MRGSAAAQSGFSLLELLVAFTIMAISLGMLYQATGTDARNIDRVQQAQRATLLAESLLAWRDAVPETGWNDAGQSAGFDWRISSVLYPTPTQATNAPVLHEITLTIAWVANGSAQRMELVTLRPQRRPLPGARAR